MEKSLAEIELNKARAARQKGNEGMSRVLSRRAAGLAIRDYLDFSDFDRGFLSLNMLIKLPEIRKHLPVSTHEALNRLCTRVEMNYQLPTGFDLILDAQFVIEQLSESNGENND